MKRLILAAILVLAAACGSEDSNFGKTGTIDFASAKLALKSSTGQDVLRLGQALTIESIDFSDYLKPNTNYMITLLNGNSQLYEGTMLTNMEGKFETQTLAHDVGEFGDGLDDGNDIQVKVDDGTDVISGKIPINARVLQGPGWTVDEVTTPHVFSAAPDGTPSNAFVVGGQDPGEVVGPIYVAGDHFPAGATVDVYVVRDGDAWKKRSFPKAGDPEHIAGPISVKIGDDGKLPATSTGYTPKGGLDLGPYDIIVDTDRNGTFDWSITVKDAADGENKVGFTVQYSQAWLRAAASKHVIVNLAYNSSNRTTGTFANHYSSGQVFGYVNPPVFNKRSDYHTRGLWVLVEHKTWNNFWNNPDPALDAGCSGCRDLTPYTVEQTDVGGVPGITQGVPIQPGCMNAPPKAFLNALSSVVNKQGQAVKTFDLVFLAKQKDKTQLIYKPGHSLLDLNIVNETNQPLDATKIDDAAAKGFTIQ